MDKKKALKIVGITTLSGLGLLLTVVFGIPKIISMTKKDATKDETKPDTKTPSAGGGTTVSMNPIGNIIKIKAFQDWMDGKHPNWLDNGTSLNKGSGYGNYGLQTTKAWKLYNVEYSSQLGRTTQSTNKAYSKINSNPIKNSLGSFFPYRMAASGEYLGILTGNNPKDMVGTTYSEIKGDDGTIMYVLYNTINILI